MGICFFVIFIIMLILNKILNKDNFLLICVYLVIGPLIKIKDFTINSSYIVLSMCFLKLFFRKKICTNESKGYVLLGLLSSLLYCISTFIYSEFNYLAIQRLIGLLKLPLIVYILISYNKFTEKKEYYMFFDKFSWIIIIANLLAGFIQMLKKEDVLSFFMTLYSDGSDYYTTVSGSHCYSRIFGLCSSPMVLGIICLFIFTFIILRSIENRKINKLQLSLCLLLGLMTSSKTFILGVPIILLLGLFNKIFLINKKKFIISKKKLLICIVIILLIPVMISLFYKGINYMTANGLYIKYYLSYLKNPLDAFGTRYSNNENILLSKTYDVINKHFVIGVGFNSVSGEFIGDSTFIQALHNGGVIGLFLILIFYFSEFIHNKNNCCTIFLIVWIITGFALPTLFNLSEIVPFICLYYIKKEVDKIDY